MRFDIDMATTGKCDACGNTGLLFKKPVTDEPQRVLDISVPMPTSVPYHIELWCAGCLESASQTPTRRDYGKL